MDKTRPRPAAAPQLPTAVLFDAYGTLFDVYSVGLLAEQLFPGQGQALGVLWRDGRVDQVLLDDRALLCRARTSPGHRGRSLILQMALDRIPDVGRARSVLEALVLDLQRQAELPEPQVNVAVLGREADLVWRNERLVVETDGYEFHRGREAFESDALRNVRLRADGWTVLRFTLRMVETRPEEVVDAIRSSLVRSWQ